MQRDDLKYDSYLRILNKHLKPAAGCTEPIAIAYASALATKTLGCLPEKVSVLVSGALIKNARSVVVPNTNGRKGIEVACAAGIIAGKPEKELEVIATITPDQQSQITGLLEKNIIFVSRRTDGRLLDVQIEMEAKGHTACVRLADYHTNVVLLKKDEKVVKQVLLEPDIYAEDPDEALLNIADIYDFSNSCDVEEVKTLLDNQIAYNTAIAEEGMTGNWGVAIGRLLLDTYGDNDVRIRAKAYAAAGSDARMSGCGMPVIINSGSGNQGITVSVPVIEYAKALKVPRDKLYRALILANLVAVKQKALIGFLSAYCGVVTAGSASGAGIAYLCGGDLYVIKHTIVNALAVLSGTICDGAKPSCAAKIASSVDAAITAHQMTLSGKQFRAGEGIVSKGVENTIANVGKLGYEGMRQTDEVILKIMMNEGTPISGN